MVIQQQLFNEPRDFAGRSEARLAHLGSACNPCTSSQVRRKHPPVFSLFRTTLCSVKRLLRELYCAFITRERLCFAGAVLPVLKQLYSVVHNSGYGRRQDGKKAQPRVFRAKLDSGDVIVGELDFIPDFSWTLIYPQAQENTALPPARSLTREKLMSLNYLVAGMELHAGDARLFVEKLEAGDFDEPAAGGAMGDYLPNMGFF